MRQADVQIGGSYRTRVGGELVVVMVSRTAGKMQHWRRRLSTVYGPRKWVEFKAMYQGEIDAKRNELAGRIRRLRRSAGIGTRKMEWVAQ